MALLKAPFRRIRKLISSGLIPGMIALWFFPSDIVKLIVRQKPVVLGLYSQGHFYALILLSLIVFVLSSLLLSKQPLGKKMLINVSMAIFSIVLSLFLLFGPVNYWSRRGMLKNRLAMWLRKRTKLLQRRRQRQVLQKL
jgi:hypothetical protein